MNTVCKLQLWGRGSYYYGVGLFRLNVFDMSVSVKDAIDCEDVMSDSDSSPDLKRKPKTALELSSMETKQSVQSCATTADVVELTDSYRDEYSGSESEEDGYSVKQKKSILKFMNDSSLDELCDIPRCSVTKVKLIHLEAFGKRLSLWLLLINLLNNPISTVQQ